MAGWRRWAAALALVLAGGAMPAWAVSGQALSVPEAPAEVSADVQPQPVIPLPGTAPGRLALVDRGGCSAMARRAGDPPIGRRCRPATPAMPTGCAGRCARTGPRRCVTC